jgi:hypothetical protein
MNASAAGRARLDAYLAELAGRLPGPRRRRARIMAELRDGLDHAMTDNTAAGLGEAQAVDAAIAGFGPPRDVAAAFTDELAIAHARQVLAWYLATGPLIGILWLLLRQPHPRWAPPVALLAALPVLPLVALAVAVAVGALATTGRLTRWLPDAGPSRALAVTLAVAGLALAVDTVLIALQLRSDRPVGSLAALAIAASLARAAGSVGVLRRTLRLRRLVTGRAGEGRDDG